jgi:acyl phosphate:glycerol-3-phosphate acyltransferase
MTITALLISYLLGSIPTAYLFVKLFKGIDIRTVGSGNVGATNALRALGKRAGFTVLFLDILKGFITVAVLGDFFAGQPLFLSLQNLRILMGLACICGHIWTIFLQFKGGKGIATSFGVLLGLALKIASLNWVVGLLILLWFMVFLTTRIVSLASICCAIGLPVFSLIFKLPALFVCLSLLLSAFVIFRHKANLLRIIKGTEPRLYFKKPVA